jgi:hypothetical protein
MDIIGSMALSHLEEGIGKSIEKKVKTEKNTDPPCRVLTVADRCLGVAMCQFSFPAPALVRQKPSQS